MERNRMIALLAGILVLVLGVVFVSRWTGKDVVDLTPTSTVDVLVTGLVPTDTAVLADEVDEVGDSLPTQAVFVQKTPRTTLEATDPATVVLGSGEIQLVEFFAYW